MKLNYETFKSLLNETFEAVIDGDKRELVLTTVDKVNASRSDGQAFSLLFSGPDEPMFPQSTYTLSSKELNDISLFLVPVGPNGSGEMCYEAVFN